ncbi:MAG: TetR-like C-terminal domain-containing protein [Trebonia sp.]
MSREHADGGAGKARHRGGRYLDSSRDVVLREAALALLAEVGYDRLTMDAVAARAGAAKTTIYRRWRDKAELVVDALDSVKGVLEVPDTGSLRQDLCALAESIASGESKFGAQMTIGLVNAVAHDTELRRVFQEKFLAPRMAGFRKVFEQAVGRGEMPGGHDLDLLAGLFPGLALQQLVMSGERPDARFAAQIMNEVVYPLATGPAARTCPAPDDDARGKPHERRKDA